MNCENYRHLMMGYLDKELSDLETQKLKLHLLECKHCYEEFSHFQEMQGVLETISIVTPEDKFWDGYWHGIYNRMERGLGWIITITGLIVLLSGGLIWILTDILLNKGEPVWFRFGLFFTMVGFVVLLMSICRERYRVMKHERYKDIRR